MRLLSWLISIPVMILVVVFSVANRQELRLDLWPLPWGVDLPVYLAVLGALVVGLFAGMIVMWLAGHGQRRAARLERRRADSLQRQLRQIEDDAAQRAAALPRIPQDTAA